MKFFGFVLIWVTVTSCADNENVLKRSKRGTLDNAASITQQVKEKAVASHNKARSTVSPTASDMLLMKWDEGLGNLAQEYSKKCLFEHSANRQTANFTSWIGENLYITTGTFAPADLLVIATKSWDAERKDYIYSTSACTKVCGHYTQVAWSSSYALGCGASSCSNVYIDKTTTYKKAMIVVCNYGPGGNLGGSKPYKTGTPCSACPSEYKHCVENMCSETGGAPAINGSKPYKTGTPCSACPNEYKTGGAPAINANMLHVCVAVLCAALFSLQ